MFTLLAALVPSAAFAEEAACPAPVLADALLQRLDEAEAAYADLEVDLFVSRVDEVSAMLPCVSEEVSRATAARVHRFQGLRAFVKQDPSQSTKAFAASRLIEPAYRFPSTLIPEGNPVHDEFLAIDTAKLAFEPLAQPVVGRIQVDGRLAEERAAQLPAVVQLFAEDGSVAWTRYAAAGAALPAYEAKPIPTGGTGPGDEKVGMNVGLLAGGGAALLGGVALSLVANGKKNAFEANEVPFDALAAHQTQTNRLATAGLVLTGVGAGLGVTAVVAGRF